MDKNKVTVEAVRAALNHAAAVVNRMSFSVAATDFATWMEALGEPTFTVNTWTGDKGGVHAHAAGYSGGVYFQVHTVAATLDGYEVPTADAEDKFLTVPASAAAGLREQVTV